MIEKYLPSNGTEGDIFFDGWCSKCARDRSMRDGVSVEDCDGDELCDIIARAFFRGEVDEWIYGPDGEPMCTAFVPAGDKVPTPRCEHTLDLFK